MAAVMSTKGQMDSPLYATYQRVDLAFERGEGAWLVATDGTRYLDFMGGIAVNVLGHAHPQVVAALKDQAEKLWHVSNIFEIPRQKALGEKIVRNTFADRVFFGNSGAEAMEAAIKTARRYHYVNGRPERFRIITFEGASSPSKAPSTAARSRPSPPAVRRNTWKVLGPRSTASTRCPSAT
jgi:acetylornithine/N-succinyldiaminopimelate aminotransferase